jgi:hypothetical protein
MATHPTELGEMTLSFGPCSVALDLRNTLEPLCMGLDE